MVHEAQAITTMQIVSQKHCADFDINFVQEHWLATFDLNRLYSVHDNMVCFVSSAMDDVISRDCLHSRPSGGVAIYIQKCLAARTILVEKRVDIS